MPTEELYQVLCMEYNELKNKGINITWDNFLQVKILAELQNANIELKSIDHRIYKYRP